VRGGARSSLQGTPMDRATWDGREEEEPAMRYRRPRRTGRWVIDLFAREWMTATDWVGLGTGHTKVAAAVCGSEICGRLICRGKAGEGASGRWGGWPRRARRDMGCRRRRELDRVGVGREARGSGGRARGRREVDVRKRFDRWNRSDGLRRGERRTAPRRIKRRP
jgi:hypothetical protein